MIYFLQLEGIQELLSFELDEEPVPGKELTAKASYHTVFFVQKSGQKTARLTDSNGMAALSFDSVKIISSKLTPGRNPLEDRSSQLVLLFL